MLSSGPDANLPLSVSLFLDLFQFCGVLDLPVPTVRAPRSLPIDQDALDRRVDFIDEAPLLVPAGEIARRRSEIELRADLARQIDDLRRQLDEVTADNTWLAAEMSTLPVTVVRRLFRRKPSRR